MYSYPFINLYIRNRYEVIFEVLLLRLFKNFVLYYTSSLQEIQRSVENAYHLSQTESCRLICFKLAIKRHNKKKNKKKKTSKTCQVQNKIRLARWKFILTLNQIKLFHFFFFLSSFILFIYSFKLFNKTQFGGNIFRIYAKYLPV